MAYVLVVVCLFACVNPPAVPAAPADHIPKELLQYYQRLLASQPARRLNPKQLLEAGVLKNRLAEATNFLENLAIKDSAEKVWPGGHVLPSLLLCGHAITVRG